MNLRQKYAEKMLVEKLDFLPFEDSLTLYLSNERLDREDDNIRFSWVCNNEELGDEFDIYINNEKESIYNIIQELENICPNCNNIVIGNYYDHFDEFTLEICPAPTYIDLIK